MPRPKSFFRFDNSSTDSGLSFRCCGKPEDLLDEPLDFFNDKRPTSNNIRFSNTARRMSGRQLDSFLVATLCNEHRLMKERMGNEAFVSQIRPPSPKGWSLHPFIFRTHASNPNLRRKPGAQRRKTWLKRRIDPQSGSGGKVYDDVAEDHLAFNDSSHLLTHNDAFQRKGDPQLRSARSMPLLNQATRVSSTIPDHRRRSNCSCSLSFSGPDEQAGIQRYRGTSSNIGPSQDVGQSPISGSHARDSYFTVRTGSAKTTSSKFHTSIFSKSPKIPALFSRPNWGNFFLHRNQKINGFD